MTNDSKTKAGKTPGQLAYEEDLRRRPYYYDTVRRPQWSELNDLARSTWERDPTPRNWGSK